MWRARSTPPGMAYFMLANSNINYCLRSGGGMAARLSRIKLVYAISVSVNINSIYLRAEMSASNLSIVNNELMSCHQHNARGVVGDSQRLLYWHLLSVCQ